MRRILTLALLPIVAFAGCLQLPDQEAAVDTEVDPATGGAMTGKEVRKDDVGVCTNNFGIDNDDRFCATRTITVDGTLRGFQTMDVAIETFNGDVTIGDAADGAWGFVATLKARGDSAAAATSRLDTIAFGWSHEDATGHFVEVSAKHEGEANNIEAAIELRMPRAIVLEVVADTSNGDVGLTGLRTSALSLSTSNGGIVAKAEVGQVSLKTSNGDIDADLKPLTSARWSLDTSNGDVTLVVPEGPSYGYSFEGDTSNGDVEYGMRDGEKGPCPQGSEYYTPPCNHRTFETHGFASRDIKVHAALDTSNGEVEANPA